MAAWSIKYCGRFAGVRCECTKGLTGADMNLMRSDDKRPVAEVDYGFVGDVKEECRFAGLSRSIRALFRYWLR